MKKTLSLLLVLALMMPGSAGVAATVQNTDQQRYQLELRPPGEPFRYYTIIENSQVEICVHGCEMVLLGSGQTITVGPNDTVVIDSGVMSVTSGD
jgi:hypothetical protein